LLFLTALVSTSWGQQSSGQSAVDLLHAALAAMGGEQKTREMKVLHLKIAGHRNFLEQSERPEGPYIVDYQLIDEWRDLEHNGWRQETQSHNALEENSSTVIVAEGVAAQKFGSNEVPGSGEHLQSAEDALALGPERVLLNGLGATDLRRLPDLTLQSVPHQLVQFTHAGTPVSVFLNAETHLPTAVEWIKGYPYGIFWSVWGDVTTRIYYSFWWLQDGIHYPLQADTFRNGLHERSDAITKIEWNPSVPAENTAISATTRAAFAARAKVTSDDRPLGSPSRPTVEPAPGIIVIPGSWNTTLIRQTDGIVILEAPISSGYSVKVLAEAERRFPGAPIKAVVTTSDAWPHIGGLREYVARGIPIYTLDRNAPLIRRLVTAPHTRYPDALERSPRQPKLLPVKGRIALGSGPNRLEILPLRGETSERQMMVYFPQHKLLYGSDAFQKTPDGKYFYRQTISEVAGAVERERLAVDNFFMMHMGMTPWQDATKELLTSP
ncbi:MAG TPA: hypothetical protein VE133_02500, partial [Candidatus Sulfotelmatobacter sp.]|nr:hypothetical protein [Candidatus Sulfotelmatobacter sp.]